MTPTTRPQAAVPTQRDRAAGIGRFGGMLTATVTAATVFLGGRHFLAPTAAPEVLTPTPVAQSPFPSSTPATPEAGAAETADAASTADSATASATTTTAAASGDAAATKTVEEPAKPPTETAEKPDASDKAAASDLNQADKDLARESWRRNKPLVTVAEGKSMILVPLKGSVEDGSHKYLTKKRTLVVTLPKAASLNTLHFNKLNKEGFATLWIDQEETNAKASDGTKLRLVFAEHAVPEVELRDEFLRVTIARPKPSRSAPAKAAAAEKAEASEETASDEKPKGREKDAD
jgi:hypothetical protein